MNFIDKIRKHGFWGSVKVVAHICSEKINKAAYYGYQKYPVDQRLIVMESEGDLSDNAYALYDYMRGHEYLEKYHVVWLVDDVQAAVEKQSREKKTFPNTEFVQKRPTYINRRWSRVLATCRWYIYDHCNMMSQMYKRDGQQLIYLSHGWGYKDSKGGDINRDKSVYDYMTATGPLAARGLSEYWKRPLNNTIITGYPRIDYFFQQNDKVKEIVNQQWQFDKYKKIIFWMPTFRKSIVSDLSEDYIQNETGLPIFDNVESLEKFSKFLSRQNILLIFKLHHLQADLPVFHKNYNNILVVRDEELQKLEIQLYQFIPFADAMISDYSSISIDYLALDRPIIFTLDDYEQYDKSRGLFPKNAIDYMPGYHVYTQKELQDAILEISDGVDKYSQERVKVIDNYHTYKDGKSSKRVLDAIGIKI